jgi:uncharacterized glyoxalase superfamily protein PhnB
MPASAVIPVLTYPDVTAAADWLGRAFGFVVRLRIADHRVQLAFGSGHLVVARGAAVPQAHSVMLRVTDADAACQRAADAGARVVAPPATYPYGERQCTVVDPHGHAWTLSQSVADIDPIVWGSRLEHA